MLYLFKRNSSYQLGENLYFQDHDFSAANDYNLKILIIFIDFIKLLESRTPGDPFLKSNLIQRKRFLHH